MTEKTVTTTFADAELDTDLWVVAWDGDQIAGVVQNWIWPEENEKLGVKSGWLEHISVRRPWRRRGLARAITAASLVRIREAGMTEGMLGVDSENANGALGLVRGARVRADEPRGGVPARPRGLIAGRSGQDGSGERDRFVAEPSGGQADAAVGRRIDGDRSRIPGRLATRIEPWLTGRVQPRAVRADRESR